jgi:DNA-binding CsgD family transcriptional regulator
MNEDDILVVKNTLNKQPYILWIDDYVNLKPFYLNDKAKAFYGFKSNDLSKYGFDFLKDLIHPDNYIYLKNSVKVFGKNPLHIQVEPTKVKTSSGEYQWVYIACRAFSFDKRGNTMYLLSLIFDIDELVGSTIIKNAAYQDSSFIFANQHVYDALTIRQKEIAKLIVNGKKNHEIAKQLSLSNETIKTHRKNLMKKLNVKNAAELVKFTLHFD